MEQNAQDVAKPVGEDRGVAYDMPIRARRYYKKGVKQDEMMMLMEMVTVNEGKRTIGRIASDMSGGFVISDDENEEQWHVSPKEIWDAYQSMRKTLVAEDK